MISRGQVAAAAAVVAGLGLAGCGEKNAYVPPPPAKVTVATPLQYPVIVYEEFTGNTAAINSVALEARVQGFLEAINYVDGARVSKGTVLFNIQRDQYQAQLDLNKAQLAMAVAKQTNAQAEYNRQATLGKQDFASQRAVDDAKTNLDSATAQIAADKANIDLATITLGYTSVTAPFDGVVTRHLADVGALVGYSGPTKLATIVQIDPIYVYFNIGEQQLLHLRQLFTAQGVSLRQLREQKKVLPVEVALQTEKEFRHRGTIDYIAPEVDPNMGTLQLRAELPNREFELIPGLFVRVRVPIRQIDKAILIDDTAIGSNQLGSYVMVINKDNVVEQRVVKTGQLEGQLRVIESGLEATDRVVIGGVQRAIPGNKVEPADGKMADPPASKGPAPIMPSIPTAPAQPAAKK